tara:strand:+ start:490 stop:714 length:225 start_codon:yes stop_codon:yes gene_type:complete
MESIIEKNIWNVAYELYIKDSLKHNHLPCKGIVKGCAYCQMFGNVFDNGVKNYNEIITNDKLFALSDDLGLKNT